MGQSTGSKQKARAKKYGVHESGLVCLFTTKSTLPYHEIAAAYTYSPRLFSSLTARARVLAITPALAAHAAVIEISCACRAKRPRGKGKEDEKGRRARGRIVRGP